MIITDLELFTPLFYDGLIKKRIGSDFDGGYIISYQPEDKYDIILSGGAGNNITFEEELTELLQTNCLIYDHTVNINTINKHIFHISKKLNKNTTCFFNSVDSYKNIFLKLDIEYGEYGLLETFTDDQLKNFKQIVIEIHNCYSTDKFLLIQKLFRYHTLIHLHANNCCGTIDIFGIKMPRIVELTLIRSSNIPQNKKLIPNNQTLPSEYDQPNITFQPEIKLDYYPFVTRN